MDRIRAYIAAGDTYQVNYSFRLRADYEDDAWALFSSFLGYAPPPHAAFVDTGLNIVHVEPAPDGGDFLVYATGPVPEAEATGRESPHGYFTGFSRPAYRATSQ